MPNDDVLYLEDLAADLDDVSPRKATAARNGARALRDADARQPHLDALLKELGARDVKEAVIKAQLLREVNGGETMRHLPLLPET